VIAKEVMKVSHEVEKDRGDTLVEEDELGLQQGAKENLPTRT